MNIQDLNPQVIWKNFYLLTQVPRPSGHLEKIQQFLLQWAAEHGVEAFKDNAENIVMRKPATAGREDRKRVVLQAHMDMVPQKLDEVQHNFETDPIEAYVDGEWVKAKGTTLGSDDGMGVAAIMAVMESKDLEHGPIEALITSDEETGMHGVNNLSPDTLHGDILLNLDEETHGEFVVGSAGGINITAELQYQEEETEADDVTVRVRLEGLRGGHSGCEIHEGRANANKLMARVVRQAIQDDDACLVSWKGGNMRNAIPRTCEVVLSLPKENVEDLHDLVAYCEKAFREEFRFIEDGITLTLAAAEKAPKQMPAEIRDNLVDAIMACHDGVLRYIPSIPGIVETSSNLAIINMGEGRAEFRILARGSQATYFEYLQEMLESTFAMAGMKVTMDGEYGAWQPNWDSPIVAKMQEVFEATFGKKPVVRVCHAGLECSIIGGKYPGMDLVAFGPTLKSPHTPDERVNIQTVVEFWEFLKNLLKAI